jgi:hypothetical protein
MALGAQRRNVMGLVLAYGGRLAVIGIALGAATALGLTQFMAGLLYGVKPGDPLTFSAAAAILLAMAAGACYLPARRATTGPRRFPMTITGCLVRIEPAPEGLVNPFINFLQLR